MSGAHTRSIFAAAIGAALLAAPPSVTLAYDPLLSASQIAQAEARGEALAHSHQGFRATGYVIFSTPDTLSLARGEGAIDAIVIQTSLQRVAYASYLHALQGTRLSVADVALAAQPYTLDLIVFAHSAGEEQQDQGFLTRFRDPLLAFQGLTAARPVASTIFGPTIDFFNDANGQRVMRWLGYVDYRFDLTKLDRERDLATLRGTFSVTDPYGRRYRQPFDLTRLP